MSDSGVRKYLEWLLIFQIVLVMKKTTVYLLIGFLVMVSGFVLLNTSLERIFPAFLFIASAAFYVESARLMFIQSK